MRLGIIVNPRARRARQPGLVSKLEQLCRDARGLTFRIFLTNSQEELGDAIQRCADLGLDTLAPCGGDGTLTATLSAAYRIFGPAMPKWLPLAGGTMNTVARNLGAVEPPARRLASVLQRFAEAGDVALQAHPTLTVHSDGEVPLDLQTLRPRADCQPRSDQRIGFLCSAAMGARFLAAYSAAAHPGLLSASLLGLRTIASSIIPGGGPLARWLFSPLPTELDVDGVRQPAPSYRLLIASTVRDVGLGMKVPWLAGTVRDRFHLIASSLSLHQNVLQLPRMLRGEPLLGQPHLDTLAQTARLKFPTPEPIVLDGELFCARQLDLSLGPTLQIVTPVVAPQGLEPRTLRV